MAKEFKPKYNLQPQLDKLPRSISMNEIIQFMNDQGISKNTLYRDLEISIDSDFSIPSERLKKYAQIFECTIDELDNSKVDVTPIRKGLGLDKSKPKKFKSSLS